MKKIKRILICAVLITVCFLLETTVFQKLAFASIIPNLLIIVTSSFGFMRGQKEGMIIGFFCGLLKDILGGNLLGFYALIYMLIGYGNGFFQRVFYDEDIKLPLALIAGSEFLYGMVGGAMCQMIEYAVKKKPYFIGKPEPGMVDMSVAQNHFTKDETLVIGDRLYTDILSGINAGVETALVLTGEATRKDAEESSYKPDYIFPTVRELHEAWK